MLTIRRFIRLFVITLEGREKFYSKYNETNVFLLILPFSGHIGLNRIVKGKRWLKEGIYAFTTVINFFVCGECLYARFGFLIKKHNRKGKG